MKTPTDQSSLIHARLAAAALGITPTQLLWSYLVGTVSAVVIDERLWFTQEAIADLRSRPPLEDGGEGMLSHDPGERTDLAALTDWSGDRNELRGFTECLVDALDEGDHFFPSSYDAFLAGLYLGRTDLEADVYKRLSELLGSAHAHAT